MTAVMRRLACLLLVPDRHSGVAARRSAAAASAAYEYRNRLYSVPATKLDADERSAPSWRS